ncbi:vWA domain-containing protein [Hespellia stercorisuis]|uniref:vWA domain-containing protein n=1 Tax=Hespellia stercorisuis TaxID=180311 RepID=UPI0009FB9E11|nr:VWA-like domain-containing protein [Hespellia stercorisuis]
MAKQKKKNERGQEIRKSVSEENLLQGIALYQENPLFLKLGGYVYVRNTAMLGKKTAAIVNSGGQIFLNADYRMTPMQWLNVIAHCQLHLAFGHFDAEKMPGYEIMKEDGGTEKKVACNLYLWNMACDMYVTKFLNDIKCGTSISSNPEDICRGSLMDEKSIYDYLVENHFENSMEYFGTADIHLMDMQGLEHPKVYEPGRENYHARQFAFALSYAVTDAVNVAGGYTAGHEEELTKSQKTAGWFVNHYPLLGGMASAFQVIEDYCFCIQNEIQVAAVNVMCGEIYVNPTAGLIEEELKFVLAHEFLHVGLQHYARCQGRDSYLWNVACDYVINSWLVDMGIGQMLEGVLYDEELKNKSAEEIYDLMIGEMQSFRKMNTLRGYGKGDMATDMTGSMNRSRSKLSGIELDELCRNALQQGLEYQQVNQRGYIPAGLIEEIRALSMPAISWDVKLGRWFDENFLTQEKKCSYARPSRRQGATPDIARPRYVMDEIVREGRAFGVVIDTSGSVSTRQLGTALGSIVSYAVAKEVPFVRVVFCDAEAYDAGYMSPEIIADRVEVKGRGGTKLQPGINCLEQAKDFPKDGPILIITDGMIENRLYIRHKHAYLLPKGNRLPFKASGKIFYFE